MIPLKPRMCGVLLTYWCNATCRNCYENCGPRWDVEMSAADVHSYLADLRQLGCTGQGIHLTGGEPFRNYGLLVSSLEAAADVGLTPILEVETNAFWCTDDEEVIGRASELFAKGLDRFFVSCDVFHQEYIPIERVRRLVRIARDLKGEHGAFVRFDEYLHEPTGSEGRWSCRHQSTLVREALRGPERLGGRAARALAPLLPCFPPERFRSKRCDDMLISSAYVHIDPYGNVFPATCAGLVVGNAKTKSLADVFRRDLEGPVARTLVQEGPVGLLRLGEQFGYVRNAKGYADACHLCFEVRRFLFLAGIFSEELGPAEIYALHAGRVPRQA